ncbi:PilZ domain-containing protein [Paenibacillus sedimenti]|uniref:PilZ domain-containing protein n=1 Tax=Paenibacillus sedimenti TaxID=2770274 RepID=A0A926KSN2_9BACL|nr:PilZ domain-containing protein [Paenibacillus sedimenti]MBD0382176.1 PilZ domain-containing protein [Paenibacillus sedimenti]
MGKGGKGKLEKRRFFRSIFRNTKIAEFSIYSYGDRIINSKPALIQVIDISASGMKLQSTITLPIDPKIIYKITIELLDKTYTLYGYVVFQRQMNEGNYYHGLNFVYVSEDQEAELVRVINRMEIKHRMMEKK